MKVRSYTNFDIVIEQAGDKYRARVTDSPAGEAATEFDYPFPNPFELKLLLTQLSPTRQGMRSIDSSEMQAGKTLGTRLFQTVFSGEVYALYKQSLDSVLSQENKGLRIRLRIDVPSFQGLPWEYLYNPKFAQFLSLSKDTPVIRYIEMARPTQALPIRPPLRVLVMISSPPGYPPLDVEEEWNRLNRALKPLIERGLVVLGRLENGSLEALRSHLRRNEVHIFHFVGHGKFLEAHEEGALLLENEQGQGKMVSGEQLGTILQDHHTLRLVVLNACEGARASEEDAYSGVAQALVRKGMPAVLAMQFPIHEQAAVRLALEFYTAIADGEPVDSALVDARKAIYTGDNDTEWGTPVLFMRIPNGVLFKIQPASKRRAQPVQQGAPEPAAGTVAPPETAEQMADRERAANLTRLYNDAQKQIENQGWAAAIDLFEQVRRIDADYLESASLLQQAQAGLAQAARLQDLVAQAKRLIQEDALLRAIRVLQQALDLSPAHPEAAGLLEQATGLLEMQQETRKQQARLAELYGQAQQRLAAGAWPEAIKLLEELQLMQPGYQDSPALLQRAQAGLDRAAKVEDLLTESRQLVQDGDCTTAIRALQQLLTLSPGHPEARQLLEIATSRLEQEEIQLKRQAALNDTYGRACERLSSQDWDAAIQLFESIEKDEPHFRDVYELLLQSRKEKARRAEQAGLLARASDHMQQRDWPAASALLQQVLAADPGNPRAQALLAGAQKGQRVDELADLAQKRLQSGRLEAALRTYEEILRLEPEDAGFRGRLEDVKRRLEARELSSPSKTAGPPRPDTLPEERKPPARPDTMPE